MANGSIPKRSSCVCHARCMLYAARCVPHALRRTHATPPLTRCHTLRVKQVSPTAAWRVPLPHVRTQARQDTTSGQKLHPVLRDRWADAEGWREARRRQVWRVRHACAQRTRTAVRLPTPELGMPLCMHQGGRAQRGPQPPAAPSAPTGGCRHFPLRRHASTCRGGANVGQRRSWAGSWRSQAPRRCM